jgi:uncharacterized protein (DUF1697 family)
LTGDFAVMLRGINVGRSGRVTMADLRRELIAANIDVVATVVQSGNLVVRHWTNSATNLARSIEQAMSQRLDITSRAIALNPNQLGLVIQANPFADVATDPSRYLVHLCEPRLTAPQYRKLEEKLIKAEYVALKRGFV